MSASSLRPTPDKKAIASIRRLSCLGLGSQIAVPTILGELHVLIPSHSNQFSAHSQATEIKWPTDLMISSSSAKSTSRL